MQRLANVYRGAYLESFHTGSIAVVDASGHLLAFAGDPNQRICMRSSAKPFQGIPLLEYGGAEDYDLSAEEIALICASHGGEPKHVSTAAALLRKGEFDEEDLLCGAHMPFDEKAAAELKASGEEPSPLHNNCSGKHAGMLLATQAMDAPSAHYIDPDHPLQVLIRSTVADFAAINSDEIPIAVDGCSAPAFYLSLYREAYAYARLMATSRREDAIGALDRYTESAAAVVESMTSSPDYVAGAWSITTPLMEAFGADLLAKEGAEGVYAMALAPSLCTELTDRLRLSEEISIGIVLKVNDGSMNRGRNPAILRTLQLLGLDLDGRKELDRYRDWPLYNVAGKAVGEVRAEFELEFV